MWININNQLPPYNKKVMVKDDLGEIMEGHYSDTYVKNSNYWCIYGLMKDSDVTHWK